MPLSAPPSSHASDVQFGRQRPQAGVTVALQGGDDRRERCRMSIRIADDRLPQRHAALTSALQGRRAIGIAEPHTPRPSHRQRLTGATGDGLRSASAASAITPTVRSINSGKSAATELTGQPSTGKHYLIIQWAKIPRPSFVKIGKNIL